MAKYDASNARIAVQPPKQHSQSNNCVLLVDHPAHSIRLGKRLEAQSQLLTLDCYLKKLISLSKAASVSWLTEIPEVFETPSFLEVPSARMYASRFRLHMPKNVRIRVTG